MTFSSHSGRVAEGGGNEPETTAGKPVAKPLIGGLAEWEEWHRGESQSGEVPANRTNPRKLTGVSSD